MVNSHAEVLAIVPARAGSKGISRKNLSEVAGRSLIAWACSVAAAAPSVGHVVITTDDEAMADEGLAHGADAVVKRPVLLATDEATAARTWQHAWEHAESALDGRFDMCVWLQPTSPARTVEDIERTVAALANTEAGSAVTVSPVPSHFAPEKQLVTTPEGYLVPYVAGQAPNTRRQEIGASYWLNGHCYAVRRDPFLKDGVVIARDAVPVVIDRPTVNIDEPFDLEVARWLLGRRTANVNERS